MLDNLASHVNMVPLAKMSIATFRTVTIPYARNDKQDSRDESLVVDLEGVINGKSHNKRAESHTRSRLAVQKGTFFEKKSNTLQKEGRILHVVGY